MAPDPRRAGAARGRGIETASTAEPGKGDRELLSFGIRAVICFGAMTARAAGGQTRAFYFYSYNIKPATYPPADRKTKGSPPGQPPV
jgi:hypothetical protein